MAGGSKSEYHLDVEGLLARGCNGESIHLMKYEDLSLPVLSPKIGSITVVSLMIIHSGTQ